MKMRKFSELVQCWGQPETPRLSEEAPAPASASATEVANGRKRGEGSGGRGPRHAVVWRPSLGAIFEDKTTATAKETAKATAPEFCGRKKERTGKWWKETPAAKGTRRSHEKASKDRGARDHRDPYGQVGVPTVIPAFSPTAFLF